MLKRLSVAKKSRSSVNLPEQVVVESNINEGNEESTSADGLPQAGLRAFSVPSRQSRLTDKLDRYKGGTSRVHEISLQGDPQESLRDKLQRIANAEPQAQSQLVEVDDIPPIILESKRMIIPLLQHLRKPLVGDVLEWVHIKEVIVIYAPALGFYNSHSDLVISLVDDRLYSESEVRSVTLNSNNGLVGCLSLDYDIHIEDFKHLSLSLNLKNSIFKPGMKWGSITMSLQLQYSVCSRIRAFSQTLAVIRLPPTTAAKLKSNPYHTNLVINTEDLSDIRQMIRSNRIINLGLPENKQEKVEYAGSVAGSSDGNDSDNPIPFMTKKKSDQMNAWRSKLGKGEGKYLSAEREEWENLSNNSEVIRNTALNVVREDAKEEHEDDSVVDKRTIRFSDSR